MNTKVFCQISGSLRNFAIQFWIVRILSVYDLGILAAFQFLVIGMTIFFNNVFLTYILRSNLNSSAYRFVSNFCVFSLIMNYTVLFLPIVMMLYLYFGNIFILLASVTMLLDLIIRSAYYRKDQWQNFLLITIVTNVFIIVITGFSYFLQNSDFIIFILIISAVILNFASGFFRIIYNIRRRLSRKSSILICILWIFRNKHLLNISVIQNISALLSFLTVFIPGATYYLGILRIIQVILSPLNVFINLLEVKLVSDLQNKRGKFHSLYRNLLLGAGVILLYFIVTQLYFDKVLFLLDLQASWNDSFLVYLVLLTGYLIFNMLDSQLNILGKFLKYENILSRVGAVVVILHIMLLLYIFATSNVVLLPLIVGAPVIFSCILKFLYFKGHAHGSYN